MGNLSTFSSRKEVLFFVFATLEVKRQQNWMWVNEKKAHNPDPDKEERKILENLKNHHVYCWDSNEIMNESKQKLQDRGRWIGKKAVGSNKLWSIFIY